MTVVGDNLHRHEWRHMVVESATQTINGERVAVNRIMYYCIYCTEERESTNGGNRSDTTKDQLQHSGGSDSYSSDNTLQWERYTFGHPTIERLNELRKQRPGEGIIVWPDGSVGIL